MTKRTVAIFAGLFSVLLLVGAAGSVYAYDRSKQGEIAEGVTVNRVALGGLTEAAAQAKLRRAVLDPLSEPVVVRYGKERFRLTAERARVGVDIAGTVDEAVARSREGNILTRSFRNLTGGTVSAAIPVDVTYSKPAVTRMVRRVRAAVDRPAVDAAVDLENGDVTPQASHNGKRVQASRLERDLSASLVAVEGDRRVRVHTRTVKPKVTTDALAERYPAIVIVNRSAFNLTLYKNLKPAKTYRIAVGQAGLETPAGLYRVENKAENPSWNVPDSDWAGDLAGTVVPPGPSNPIKARWMGIYAGAGIHGTDAVGSLGTAASHGCIRMAIPDVEELYDQVPVQAPVYIN